MDTDVNNFDQTICNPNATILIVSAHERLVPPSNPFNGQNSKINRQIELIEVSV